MVYVSVDTVERFTTIIMVIFDRNILLFNNTFNTSLFIFAFLDVCLSFESIGKFSVVSGSPEGKSVVPAESGDS